MIEQFLLDVRKPARYIGGEWNVTKKDLNSCDTKFALCFPDLYELGMSYLGLRILYGLLNEQKNICCERVFAVADDFEKVLRANKIPLFSLENRIPLKEFDILGFSITYELNYTNILNMLDLGGIPLFSKDRDFMEYPLVIGGGNCTLNPEPVADFFDLFLVGDGEEAILEIVSAYQNYKGSSKKELLENLTNIEGVYVPSLQNFSNTKFQVRKRVVKDLNKSYFPKNWIVPYIEIVHDRLSLEIMRGCPNQCYFCQARVYYWPYREKQAALLKEEAISLYKNTGYEEMSLMGLSASDYSKLEELIAGLYDFCNEHKIAISFPSIRPKVLVSSAGRLLSKIKKTTITFAPETASCRLRNALNKNLEIEELVETAQSLFEMGYLHLKLYFMIGLPNEANEDLDEIVSLCAKLILVGNKPKKKQVFLNLSISNFIPKPHTVLQWLGLEEKNILEDKQKYLYAKLKSLSRNIKVSFHNLETSVLEAILSRGDRALSKVIHTAWKNGAKFDGWQDHFNFSIWNSAFKSEVVCPENYLNKIDMGQALPWDFIETGISKQNLRNAYKNFDLKNRQ